MNNKANHTIHFAEGSCVFQAGSSMFGDVHMEGSTIYQGMPKAPETQEAAPCGEEVSYAQSNSIFRASLFKTEEAYVQLRKTILAFVKQAGVEPTEEYQIDPACQAEWYYVLKGLAEAGKALHSGVKDTDFVSQMLAWYPELFNQKEGEEEKKMVRRYAQCISSQRQRWVTRDKQEVPIKDMFVHNNLMNYSLPDTTRFRGVALGLKKQIEALLKGG